MDGSYVETFEGFPPNMADGRVSGDEGLPATIKGRSINRSKWPRREPMCPAGREGRRCPPPEGHLELMLLPLLVCAALPLAPLLTQPPALHPYYIHMALLPPGGRICVTLSI